MRYAEIGLPRGNVRQIDCPARLDTATPSRTLHFLTHPSRAHRAMAGLSRRLDGGKTDTRLVRWHIVEE